MGRAGFVLFLLVCWGLLGAQSGTWKQAEAELQGYAQNRAYEKLGARAATWRVQFKGKSQEANLVWVQGYAAFKLGQYERAEGFFQQYLRLEAKPQAPAFWFIAQSLQRQGKHETALWYYKHYLKFLSPEDGRIPDIKVYIEQCEQQGLGAVALPAALITNLEALNSSADDFLLLHNSRYPNHGFISSNRPPDEPIGGGMELYMAEQSKAGLWQMPRPLHSRYNSPADELLFAFEPEGYRALYWREGGLVQEVWDSSLGKTSKALPWLAEQLEPQWKARDPYLWSANLVLFAAWGPESYGGLDLYFSYRDAEGKWSAPRNLGAEVNTPYQEVAPYLAPDGKTLYFSSLRPEGFGGYDIYRLRFLDSCLCWTDLSLLPQPYNSPAEDLYFRERESGRSAYLSSDRAGGRGGMDIYELWLPEAWGGQTKAESFWEAWLLGQLRPQPLDSLAEQAERIQLSPWYLHESPEGGQGEKIRLSPYHYGQQNDLQQGQYRQRLLGRLAPLLRSQAGELRLLWSLHSLSSNPVEDLALAEAWLAALKAQIPTEVWRLRLCGNGQALSLTQLPDGSPNPGAEAMNKRLETRLLGRLPKGYALESVEAQVSASLTDSLGWVRRQLEQQAPVFVLSLPLQTLQNLKPQNQAAFETLSQYRQVEFSAEQPPRLLWGFEPSLVAIRELQTQTQALGLKPQILLYFRGWELQDPKAIEALSKRFPELKNWLRQD